MKFLPEDWATVFMPQYPMLELVVRGILLYFIILFILRLLPRRTTGELGAMDLVLILLLAEVASNALGDFTSIGDGLIMFLVFMACSYGVNQLTYHVTFMQKLFEHAPVQIIKDGKILLKNMRKELITRDELIANLRENGIEQISEVKKAYVESEGNISFITYEKENEHASPEK